MPVLKSKYIKDDIFKIIVENIPLPCVDMIAVRKVAKKYEIGIVIRKTGPEKDKYAIVGGIVRKGETIIQAMKRHLEDDLGLTSFEFIACDEFHPFFLQRYYHSEKAVDNSHGYDPTKDALTPIYLIKLTGTPKPKKQASNFIWISEKEIPSPKKTGYQTGISMKAAFKYLKSLPLALNEVL
ncbi:hypothetical protein A2715_02535 [Candidatus Woesebacteria bacterium RIFCSPHIGHO2_01_FULL_39_32]|uniref:Nudix hydrolase domain-containing protein n=1 Tax=Candidatus Woesebacteria bacterium RIFCSPLOWO2_01_FULL_39_25 TaxID=1802521 RepID=A0A1F8BK11_9BACT|nr:MAG: hypothetical protein A2124_02205 [Candidatus Woesebacteria bacterium GWB1_37_5]OGM24030.1 MAG: hypothetical protein A2715_02535 [Candidatus Woesebacteria bacterium RIFCSPHIGHO2_01_FULL_39_32]OGM38029.1 MAG: hypothetical protein A3F01_05845 [Candidatus Woesebacteria bacterium RIFCSPHIGHO2_12_FULL_38_11]OGM64373.1 MAG: hypothetical protein A2893_00710 [Candidatus Woesebacteria bacterium RIFCSPLOWO2_01_FULL_39_25]